MTESTTARPEPDPISLAIAETMPTFTIDDGVEAARDIVRQLKMPPEMLPAMKTEDRMIGFGEITGVPVRIYWPASANDGSSPVVVFYHGGGWAIGDLDSYEAVARGHAIGADAIVVSVGYRLA